MSPELPIAIRRARPADLPFILRGWVRSLSFNRPWVNVERSWYCAAQHALALRLLARSDAFVAVDPDDDTHLYGVCVAEATPRTLHWVYTKGDFRRFGVASRLMAAVFGDLERPIGYTVRTTAIPHYEGCWHLKHEPHRLLECTDVDSLASGG